MNNETMSLAVDVETANAPIVPEIPPRTPVDAHNMALTLLAILAVVFVLDWAQAVFVPLILGVIISYALSPLVNQMQKWHVPRPLGAALLLLAIIGGLGWMAYSLKDEAASMLRTLPEAAQKLRKSIDREWRGTDSAMEQVQKAAQQIERAAAESTGARSNVPRGVTRVQIETPVLNVRDYLWSGTLGMLAIAGLGITVLFLAYFLLVSGDTFRRKLVKISGPTLSRKKVTLQMLNDITQQIQRYMLVQLFTSTLVGVATWLAFEAIGVENAAVWGVVSAVFNTIPYVGAIIVTGGIALVAFLQYGTLGMAVMVSGVSLFITSIEGYLLTPWLTSRAGQISAVVVFTSVLFWGWLWGAWGLLLGVPIIMAIKAVCDHVEDFKPLGELLGK